MMAKRSLRREVTRFAPSPTGYLHLGHAFAALTAWNARGPGGRFFLRIEDIDAGRCRDEFVEAIFEDLSWLGLEWETPVRRQSEHTTDYRKAVQVLTDLGLVYPCFCTRADIRAEVARAGQAPHGPEGIRYPGLCRKLPPARRDELMGRGVAHAMRLDMDRAAAAAGPLTWIERGRRITANPRAFGDIVVARRDAASSYHVAVTVDDHLQGVTLITRGEDLAPLTDVHCLLQFLLGLEPPAYNHHRLITDHTGRRLAKRDKGLTIRALREAGHTPGEVIALSGFRD